MNNLLTLTETDDSVEILPVDAKISIQGPTADIRHLLQRVSAVAVDKEIIVGTSLTLLEATLGGAKTVPYLRATATDGEKTISVVADNVQVFMPGSAQIPAKRAASVLKVCPGKTTKIEAVGSEIIITSGRARWTIQGPKYENVLAIPSTGSAEQYAVNRHSFLEALQTVRKAVLNVSDRRSLMQIEVKDGHMTACDSNRVHRQIIKDFPPELEFAIPAKAVEEIAKALKETNDEIVQMSAKDFVFEIFVGDDSITCQQLTVAFPDVEYMIRNPSITNSNRLVVKNKELVDAVTRVRVNADPDYSAVFLTVIEGKKTESGQPTHLLSIKAKDKNGNSAQEILHVQWTGLAKPKEICVNYKYLLDVFQSLTNEHVTIMIGDDTKKVKYPLYFESLENGFSGIIQQMNTEYM